MNRTYRTPPPHRFIFVAALVCASWPAWAQADSSVSEASTIEAQPLDAALKAFALQAGMQLVYVTDLVRGRGTGGAKGAPTVAGVLTQLLAGTGLTFEFLNARTVLIRTQTTEVARAGYRGAGAARKNRNAEGTPDIEEVVVTARKREETVFDVPMAVSVLTGISLEQRGAASLTDVLQDVPSLNAIDFGNGLPSINLRGISTEAGSNEVGYYLDELPLAGIRVPLKPDVRAWDIERVEVLRGPQGTLFGEGSMGGTIRTITRDPQFNEWQTQFAMQGSHTEGGGFNEGYKGMLNIPLLEDRMALRLTGTKEKTADWGQDTAGSSSDLDSQHIATYRAKLLWRPVDRLAINASYWHYDADFSGGFYATEDLDVSRTVKYPSHLRYGLGGVTATYDLDSVSVLYSIAYNTLANPQVSPFPRNRMEQGLDVRTTSQELRFSSSGPATLEWTAGLFDRDAYRADSLYVQSSGYRILVGAHARSQALFGEATYRLPSIPVRLSAGARVVREVLDDDQMNSNDMLLVTQNTTYHSVDPRFSIAWDPSNDLRLYTSAAKGYRSGQTQLRTSLELAKRLGIDVPAILQDDWVWTYELGVKARYGARVSAEAAVYHSRWNRPVVRAPLGRTGVAAAVNSRGTRINGVEATLGFEITRAWSFTLGGGYTDAVYTNDVPASGIVAGDEVDFVSKVTASAALEWRQPVFAGLAGYGRLGVQYNSPRTFNSYGATFAPPGDAITSVTARVGLQAKRWGAFLFVNNLVNERGSVSAGLLMNGSGGVQLLGTRLPPRTVGVELTVGVP